MKISENEYEKAVEAGERTRRRGYAIAARYNQEDGRLMVSLHNGMELTVPTRQLQGLAGAEAEALSNIEITPSGLGLHWPDLDADIYVPGLLNGLFGTQAWMSKLEKEFPKETPP